MSAKIVGMVLESFPARDAQQLAIAVVLADAADHDGSHVFPSVARVARFARTSERTVQRALADFRAVGFLVLVAPGGGRGKPSAYRIDVAWLGRQTSVLDIEHENGDPQSPFQETVTDGDGGAGKPRQKGDKRVTKPCHSYGTQPTNPSTCLPTTTIPRLWEDAAALEMEIEARRRPIKNKAGLRRTILERYAAGDGPGNDIRSELARRERLNAEGEGRPRVATPPSPSSPLGKTLARAKAAAAAA